MNNYSICYLDSEGHTQNSELLPFEDNRTAVEFARTGLDRSAIVEIWKDSDLVRRLFRDPTGRVAGVGVVDNAVRAFARADSRNDFEGWDNEGGAALPRVGASR